MEESGLSGRIGTVTQAIWWLLIFVDNELTGMKFWKKLLSGNQTVSRMVLEGEF